MQLSESGADYIPSAPDVFRVFSRLPADVHIIHKISKIDTFYLLVSCIHRATIARNRRRFGGFKRMLNWFYRSGDWSIR